MKVKVKIKPLPMPPRIKLTREGDISRLYKLTYAGAPNGAPVIENMRGDLKSRILLIGPPPRGDDFSTKLPFSDKRGAKFHELCLEHAGFDTETALVIPTIAYGDKPNVRNVPPMADFVKAVGKAKLFDKYLCVGSKAYQYIFGEGARGPMQTLIGNVTYVPETDFMPLMVLPDVDGLLAFEMAGLRDWQQERVFKETISTIVRVMPKLKAFLAV